MNTGNVLQKIWALSLVVLLAGFIGIGQVIAQSTYYVDAGAGNDAFNGSQMTVGAFPAGPFATITAAVTAASDGDTIVVKAGTYAAALNIGKTVTISALPSGANVNVNLGDLSTTTAGKTLTLAGAGTFVSGGGATALVLTNGSLVNNTTLSIPTGSTVTRALGSLTGTAPSYGANINVIYNGALTSAMTAGNELPASLGTGKLTLSHTGDLLTIPNSTTVNDLQKTTAGNVTFSQNLITTGGGATDVDVDGAGTFTVSGTATIAGGIDVDAAVTFSWGATSIAGAAFDNNGGALTFASFNATDQTVTNTAGTTTVTGDLRLGVTASATRVTVTAGSMTVGSLTADPLVDTVGADEADVVYTINNDATFTVNGAITEGALAVTNGVNAEGETGFEYSVFTIDNADGQEFTIGANSTISGDISNAERDGGVDGDGIILANGATLTVLADRDAAAANLTSIGDIVGGTLVLNYAAAGSDIITRAAGAANTRSLTLVNNLTLGSSVATYTAAANADGAADATLSTLSVGGNLRIEASATFEISLTVSGIVYIAANNVKIDAVGDDALDAIDKSTGLQGNWGGLSVGSSTGFSVGTNSADASEDVTITGTTADPGSGVFGGKFAATSAAVTTKGGFESDEFQAASHTAATGTTTVGQANGAYDVAGAVVVASGATLSVTSAVATDDAASLDIDGTFLYTSTGTLTVSGDIDIDASTGAMTTAGAADFVLGGSFTGGTYTDTGSNDDITFNIPVAGATLSPKPGTTFANLVFNGTSRTMTVSESFNVAGNLTVGNDAILALGGNTISMTGAAKTLTLDDEASITNSGTNGSVAFSGANQIITVTGNPLVAPSLQNVTVNNAAAASPLTINESIKIAGTLALLDGGVVLNGTGGVNNAAITLTFTSASAAIARVIQNEGITTAGAGGSIGGTYDLVLSGTTGAAGVEWSAAQMDDITISASGAVTGAATVATATGNLVLSDAAATLTLAANLTVNGNVTLTGSAAGAFTLATGGVLTLASGEDIGTTALSLTGNDKTHSVAGEVTAATTFSGTGIIVNGGSNTADADGASEFGAITSASASSATLNDIQVVNGAVIVNGSLALNLVADGGTGAGIGQDANDAKVGSTIDVNAGGALTLTSALGSTTAFSGGAITVDDNGSFTAGGNLNIGHGVTVGNGANATPATFDLNGKTVVLSGGVTLTAVASGAPATAPGFGTSGTLSLTAASNIDGATNPTIPNLSTAGGAASDIDSDVTVTGTFTVSGAASIAAGETVTLSGASAVAQINANLTSGTIGTAGGTLKTTGTTINSTAAGVTITNLNVASTSSTVLANNDPAAGVQTTTFTVAFLDHDSGVLDIGGETLTIVGDDNAANTDWDYDGGSYSMTTGSIVIDDAGNNQEIDIDTNDQNVTVANLTTLDNAAGTGLALGASDTVTVNGTLTLSGLIQTENGANDGAFVVADGASVVVTVDPVADLFDNAPTLGDNLAYNYAGAPLGSTTGNELKGTNASFASPTAGFIALEDGVSMTTGTLTLNHDVRVDANADDDQTLTIADGGVVVLNAAAAALTTDSYTAAGALTVRVNASIGADATLWPTAYTSATVDVRNGTFSLAANRTAGTVLVGDGTGAGATAVLATGAFTLTGSSLTLASDGSVTGTVNITGAVTATAGNLAAATTAQGNVSVGTGATVSNLTLNGTAAQTLTVPAAGYSFAALTVNNAAGATVAGGNVAVGSQTLDVGNARVAAVTPGLALTAGVLNMGSNSLLLPHGGSGQQGYTQTAGCVFGNVRKSLSNTTATAPADRMEFPLCSMSGVSRPYAITFNNPSVIGGVAPPLTPSVTGAPAMTVRHDVSGENSVVDLAGTNGLPVNVNGVSIARYPRTQSFFWTVSPNFTLSPAITYDVDMRANDYAGFSSSCGSGACDINEIYPIRRHVGSDNNQWTVASTTTDNFLAGADDPVVIGRSATGALQTSGTVFTFGLKSIFASAASAQSFTTTTGNTHVVDISTLFTGYTGDLTYSAVSSDATGVTNPTTANVAGNDLTITGGADVGSATVTVDAVDSFGAVASATFTVTNAAALTPSSDDLDRTLNVGDTSTLTFASVFSGGTGDINFPVPTSSAPAVVAVSGDGETVTMSAASSGTATVTLSATDASSTPVTVTKTFTVTVNDAVSVANPVNDQQVVQGDTLSINVSNVFANGTGDIGVAVSGGNDTASAEINAAGTVVTVVGLAAYAGTPLADTAPVTITLTGTDTIGGSATDAFDVTVNPAAGAVSGGGAPSAFDAALILNEFLGLSSPALTAKQMAAADYDGDADIDPFDAYQVYVAAGGAAKTGVRSALASADVSFGEMTQNGTIISLPILIVGDVANAAAVSFETTIDPAFATVAEVVNNSDWIMVSDVAEDGTVRFAAIGGESLPADGVVATININVPETFAAFTLNGKGAVNNNTISEIDAVEVIEIPGTFALDGNYPNPFNPTTTIQFDLPESADVEVQIFDMIGRQVMSIPAQTIAAGAKRSLQVNASQLASGSYFYRVVAKMQSSVAIDTGRMTLVK